MYMLLLPQNWNEVQSHGNGPSARFHHAACYIEGDDSLLLVIGGMANGQVFSDVWLLDAKHRLWKEVYYIVHVHSHAGYTSAAELIFPSSS